MKIVSNYFLQQQLHENTKSYLSSLSGLSATDLAYEHAKSTENRNNTAENFIVVSQKYGH